MPPMPQDQRDRRMAEIETAVLRFSRFDKLTESQEQEQTELIEERNRLLREEALANAVRLGTPHIESGVDSYNAPRTARRAAAFTGDPWERGTHAGAPAAEVRGQALAAVQRSADVPDDARQRAAVAVESDDDPDSRLARFVVESSQPAYRAAVLAWMADPHLGHYSWDDAQRAAVRRVQTAARSMNLGSDAAGAAMVLPFSLDPAWLLSSDGAVDPMRAVSRVVQSATNERRFVTSDGVSAGFYAEGAEVTETDPALNQPKVVCHKGAAYVQTSYELLEDAADLTVQLGAAFADGKAQAEARVFTVGTGVGEPRGIVTAVTADAALVTDVATAGPAAADVLALQAAVPPRWRPAPGSWPS